MKIKSMKFKVQEVMVCLVLSVWTFTWTRGEYETYGFSGVLPKPCQ